MSNKSSNPNPIFDYDVIWLITGLIGLFMPIILWFVSGMDLESISASYCKGDWPRNLFVGMLFIVGSLLFILKGFKSWHRIFSWVAGPAAFGVALFPGCGTPEPIVRWFHALSALILFVALGLICILVFRPYAEPKSRKTFLILGILLILLIILIIIFAGTESEGDPLIFALETIILWVFALAWMIAYKKVKPQA